MALYDRLIGVSGEKIPVHAFYAMMTERRRGQVTNQQVIDAFALTAPEQAELATLVARVAGNFLTGPEIHEVLLLGESRIAPFATVAAIKTRFGV